MFAIGLILCCFAGTALVMTALNWIAARQWRAARQEHWAERARLLYPVRITSQINALMLTGSAILVSFWSWKTRPFWVWFGVAGFLGALLGNYALDRAAIPEFTFRKWLAQAAIGLGTRVITLAPFIIAIVIAPPEWNMTMLWIALGFAIWHAWSNVGGFVDVWRWLRILKPVPQLVSSSLEQAYARSGTRPRQVLFFSSPLLLAFAVPLRNALIFSEGLLTKCSSKELNAIALHELAHLSEDRRSLAQRVLSSFALYPFILIRPAIGAWGMAGLVPIYAVFLVLLVSARRVGRKGEIRADQIAARQQFDQGLYARALLKIYSENQAPAVMPGKRQVHPHLYDRMLAAGVSPDFDRPRPPQYATWTVLVPIVLLFILGLGVNI